MFSVTEQAGYKINSMQLFGEADVNTTEQGRTFKKQTNEAGFSIQYNK